MLENDEHYIFYCIMKKKKVINISSIMMYNYIFTTLIHYSMVVYIPIIIYLLVRGYSCMIYISMGLIHWQ